VPITRTASYIVVLRTSHVPRTFAAALIARFAYGILFLSLVLAVSRATRSYAVSGGALAVFGLTSSVLAPYRARMIDRYGPRLALLPMAVLCAAMLGLIAAVCWQPGAPRVAVWVLSGAAGACAPPLGPFMRGLWTILVPEDGGLLQRAYSLDAVAEELLYVAGPLVAGAFTAFANPAMGVSLSAVLLLGGTAALVASPVAAGFAGARVAPSARDRDESVAPGSIASHRRRLWPGAGLLDPVIVTAGLGASVGSLNLLAVAFAGAHGGAASVSWISAAMAVSSALGGLLYGAVSWRIRTRIRLPLLAAFLGLFCALAGQAGGMVSLGALTVVVGFLISPTLTTAYLIAAEVSSAGGETEAGTWVNSAFNSGNAAGAAGIGLLLSPFPLALCFVVAGAMIFLPALTVAARQFGQVQYPPPADS
jgi:hypothetical protein